MIFLSKGILGYVGGCQNYGPVLDSHYNTAPNILGTQKGTIILTTAHVYLESLLIQRCLAGFTCGRTQFAPKPNFNFILGFRV